MRSLTLAAVTLILSSAGSALEQPKASLAKSGETIRYFNLYNFIDDLETDVLLKETRQGAKVIAAELDFCHATVPNAQTRDRTIVSLKPEGNAFIGSAQSQEFKQPVGVNLVRSGSPGKFNFSGTIKYGDKTYKISSADNSDVGENELEGQLQSDESIVEKPADFTEQSPQSVAIRVNRPALLELLTILRGMDVRVSSYSLPQTCETLRAGRQDLQIDVDPERAAGVIAKAKAMAGVLRAGYSASGVGIDRALRFPAAGWRDAAGKLERDKLAEFVSGVAAKVLTGKAASSSWDKTTGELSVIIQRPDDTVPGLGLVEAVKIPFVVGGETPAGTSSLVLRMGFVGSNLIDDQSGPKLSITPAEIGEERTEPPGSDNLLPALARELKGQLWDADNSAWRK